MKKLALILVVATLAGCATIEGIGRDLAAGARAVNNAF